MMMLNHMIAIVLLPMVLTDCPTSLDADRSMHGEMLRRMAEGDRGRQKIKEEEERAAKVGHMRTEDDCSAVF